MAQGDGITTPLKSEGPEVDRNNGEQRSSPAGTLDAEQRLAALEDRVAALEAGRPRRRAARRAESPDSSQVQRRMAKRARRNAADPDPSAMRELPARVKQKRPTSVDSQRGKSKVTRRLASDRAEPLAVSDSDFQTRVDQLDVGVAADFDSTSTTMLLAFGGLALKMGMPPFEFFALTGDLPVKRLFVRDVHQAWYHRGVPGYGDDIETFAERLKEIIDEQGVERLVVAGNSAGGFAALMFGTILKADVVLAFSPQTFVDREKLWAIDDHRWDVKIRRLYAAGGPNPRFADLGQVLPAMADPRTRYEVHYPGELDFDVQHARSVASIPNLTLHPHPAASHGVIRVLRADGTLSTLLTTALAGETLVKPSGG